MQKRVNCKRCVHYYVTWQAQHPHGCKAFGFKSKIIPSMQVLKDSGKPCGMFEEKKL
ncbi:MAG TPA: uracil-DNA glycosylase [Campylobacterales bacterium]|nr:uracil-DNA glycosylase [Campylobacterales bacterium]